MRVFPILFALLFATPALAKDVTITLNDNEQQVLVELLDAALKARGLSASNAVTHFATKLRDAANPTPAPTASPKPTLSTKPIEPSGQPEEKK